MAKVLTILRYTRNIHTRAGQGRFWQTEAKPVVLHRRKRNNNLCADWLRVRVGGSKPVYIAGGKSGLKTRPRIEHSVNERNSPRLWPAMTRPPLVSFPNQRELEPSHHTAIRIGTYLQSRTETRVYKKSDWKVYNLFKVLYKEIF